MQHYLTCYILFAFFKIKWVYTYKKIKQTLSMRPEKINLIQRETKFIFPSLLAEICSYFKH